MFVRFNEQMRLPYTMEIPRDPRAGQTWNGSQGYGQQYGNQGYGQQYGNCFCPPYWNQWGSFPTFHQNLPDANVGERGNFWWHQDVKGYGIDMDGDGRYTRGRDGVLAFDQNHDGKIDRKEIEKSNQMMKAFGGDYDLNGDGNVSWWERMKGESLKKQMSRYDRDHDGRLNTSELSSAGAKVWIDRDGDGKAGTNETYSPYNFPTQYGQGSLGFVDPRYNYSQVNNQCPWFQPFPPFPWMCGGRFN
ncbi:MAG: hypothetical protein AB2L14_37655 [Candidatus Xenobiia bacterium LiM19]